MVFVVVLSFELCILKRLHWFKLDDVFLCDYVVTFHYNMIDYQ
jgi:hypothetical protein